MDGSTADHEVPIISPSTSSSNRQQLFTVGKLLAEKFENGVAHFKVRWKNYSSAHDTWEPESNLSSVAELVQQFRQKGAVASGSGVGSSAHTTASSSSRKRNANRKWDVVPASQLVASKTKFFDDLEAGKIDIRSNDLYSRVKCRRRINGDSESAASDLDDDEIDVPGLTTSAVAALSVVAKDVIANNSASSCDSGCPVTPPKQQQQQQQQQSLLNNLLLSAKKPRIHTQKRKQIKQQQKQQQQHNDEGVENDEQIDDEIDEFDDLTAVDLPTPSYSQVELFRAHLRPSVSGDIDRIDGGDVLTLSAKQQFRRRRRSAPLSFAALCQAVERGDWLAVQRTLMLRGSFSRASLAMASVPLVAVSSEERLTLDCFRRLLCLAASRGHACLVDLLLAKAPEFCDGQNLDVNFQSPDPCFGPASPLMLAVEQDSLPTVHRLLIAGADPDHCCFDDSGVGGCRSSALYRAIRNRRPHLVEALCSEGGVDFAAIVDSRDNLTALRYAKQTCQRSALVLQRYAGQVCKSMHDLLIDRLGRFGFEPAVLLFAPHYVRPGTARRGHVLALIHCHQQPRSLLLAPASGGAEEPPLSLHCWLSDGPCHVTSVLLNDHRQLPLSVSGDRFLVGLSNCLPGENRLRLTFSRCQQQQERLRCLRIGVFAFRLVERTGSEAATADS
uniref:Chromo domain-containing protein n=1 Tax=Macrostomum lignano TaxID=282301 RepID=A0A1I8GI69_9PLAT